MALENFDIFDIILLILSTILFIGGILLGPKKKRPIIIYKATPMMKIKRKFSSAFHFLRNIGRGGA